eukprot:g13614.t1
MYLGKMRTDTAHINNSSSSLHLQHVFDNDCPAPIVRDVAVLLDYVVDCYRSCRRLHEKEAEALAEKWRLLGAGVDVVAAPDRDEVEVRHQQLERKRFTLNLDTVSEFVFSFLLHEEARNLDVKDALDLTAVQNLPNELLTTRKLPRDVDHALDPIENGENQSHETQLLGVFDRSLFGAMATAAGMQRRGRRRRKGKRKSHHQSSNYSQKSSDGMGENFAVQLPSMKAAAKAKAVAAAQAVANAPKVVSPHAVSPRLQVLWARKFGATQEDLEASGGGPRAGGQPRRPQAVQRSPTKRSLTPPSDEAHLPEAALDDHDHARLNGREDQEASSRRYPIRPKNSLKFPGLDRSLAEQEVRDLFPRTESAVWYIQLGDRPIASLKTEKEKNPSMAASGVVFEMLTAR